jgi:hypothetical protein
LESRVHLTVHARFGGEGLVLLGNQDPASYPTFLVKMALTGLFRLLVPGMGKPYPLDIHLGGPLLRSTDFYRKGDNSGTVLQSELEQLAGLSVQLDYRRSFWGDSRANSADNSPNWFKTLPIILVSGTVGRETVPAFSTLRLRGVFLNAGPSGRDRQSRAYVPETQSTARSPPLNDRCYTTRSQTACPEIASSLRTGASAEEGSADHCAPG